MDNTEKKNHFKSIAIIQKLEDQGKNDPINYDYSIINYPIIPSTICQWNREEKNHIKSIAMIIPSLTNNTSPKI